MRKITFNKKMFIGVIVVLTLLIALNAYVLGESIIGLIKLCQAETYDSFWTFGLAIAFIAETALVIIASIVGIGICIKKIKAKE